MEPVIDAFKGFVSSGAEFFSDLVHRNDASSRRNPIQILKRLQREAFSDIMKLRDRQDKVERFLSFYKTSNKSPFSDASTHVRGEVNILGGVLKMDEVDEQNYNSLRRAGIRTGIDARFTFETNIREKDLLVAELIANHKVGEDLISPSGCPPLSLAKVFYRTNVTDWFSAVAIPVGAQCRDVGASTTSFYQGRGLTDHSSSGPPLADQQHGSAIGVTVRKSNVVASLGHFVSGLGIRIGGQEIGHFFSTFGQVICQLPRGTKLSLMGLHQNQVLSNHSVSLGPLAIPLRFPKPSRDSDRFEESSGVITLSTSPRCLPEDHIGPEGSIALMLESELDEKTRIGGWVEMKTSNTKNLQWALTLSDDSEDDLGWGLSLSGKSEGSSDRDRLQVESYLKFKLGSKLTVQPGLVHVLDGDARITAFLVRSNWFL